MAAMTLPPTEPPDRRTAPSTGARTDGREWMMVALGLTALVSIIAALVAIVALAAATTRPTPRRRDAHGRRRARPHAAAAPPRRRRSPTPRASTFEQFEPRRPDAAGLPAGAVKKFKVDVYQHVTQVSKDLAPTEVWSFAVNGVEHRGTGVSAPMVVTEGDIVDFTLTNGSTEAMKVDLPHSLDFHSAEVNPGTRYADLAPGKSMHYRFIAEHPGVFMYHCATQPVLMHTGAGMVGMFVVKPKNLAPVDKELWITQQEYYIGKPGEDADMAKMQAKTARRDRLQRLRQPVQGRADHASSRARRSACTSSTPARASGAPST